MRTTFVNTFNDNVHTFNQPNAEALLCGMEW